MYIPLGIRSDYSLLQSLIKIPELIDVQIVLLLVDYLMIIYLVVWIFIIVVLVIILNLLLDLK